MEHNFPFGYSGWEFWSTSEDVPFISGIFRSGEPKKSFHLHSNRNFRIFSVNGKHSRSPCYRIGWVSNIYVNMIEVNTTFGVTVSVFCVLAKD